MTRFGKDNPILDEIMSYAQGSDDLHEFVRMMEAKKAKLPNDVPVVNVGNIAAVNQTSGTIVDEEAIEGTIVDEKVMPNGFILELPVNYAVYLDEKGTVVHEGIPVSNIQAKEASVFNKIYVPKSTMRRCWMHDTGKLGMNDIGAMLNNLVVLSHRLLGDPSAPINMTLLYRCIFSYFSKLASMMGGKRGEISTLGMAVRYPMSAKATATLSNRLPANTIEIHEGMAEKLAVKNGDVVLVERFPCLGFMSIRPQKVRITKDEMARYTIRVSGNSLCSLGLDFDGDVIYLASFHTPEARELLRKEWENPNPACYEIICKLNGKAGQPRVDSLVLDDYNITAFEDLTAESHAELVNRATGVKSHTGPVIALAYNIMRILENSPISDSQDTNVAIEYFLDRVGNTVFKQKHGVKSLHAIVTDAICIGDVETLVKEGFDRETSAAIIEVIKKKAAEIGEFNLPAYHKKAKENGWSNIINRIVREQNKIYYASRANLEGCELLTCLKKEAVDVPSSILTKILSGKAEMCKTKMEEFMDHGDLNKLHNDNYRDACAELFKCLDKIISPSRQEYTEKSLSRMRESFQCFRRGAKCLSLKQ
jgi:hypothetical protein